MDIREKMLPVLGPQGGDEEINALREVMEFMPSLTSEEE